MTSHLQVDRQACAGHGLCYATAPDIVDCDDQGDPVVLSDPIPAEEVESAQRAVEMCPERALTLEED